MRSVRESLDPLSRIGSPVRRIIEMTATNESSQSLCRTAPTALRVRRAPLQFLLDAFGWLISGTVFAAMPKCPACLAAYLAAASGIGISIPAAGLIRTSALSLCLILLVLLSARQTRRLCTKC